MAPARAEKATPKLSELRARVAELERERELLNAIANWAPSSCASSAPTAAYVLTRRTRPSSGRWGTSRRRRAASSSGSATCLPEALANVAKYAGASAASVRVRTNGDRLEVEVAADGVGGADASQGTGLRGLADRVAALDGTFAVDSPTGGGTSVRAAIPLRQ